MGNSDSLAHVVEQFVDKLHTQLPVLEKACEDKNFEEVASIAHWLKGSGGTVGFDVLYQPAKELENCAKKNEHGNVLVYLEQIKGLAQRLRAGKSDGQEQSPVSTTTAGLLPQETGTIVDTPIESRLAEQNPAFRPIILSFVSRLESQLAKLEAALAADDLVEVANIAHWLKGSGGTVGFEIFTEPAAEMERGAKNNDNSNLGELLNQIKTYANNIVVPGNDSDAAEQRDTA